MVMNVRKAALIIGLMAGAHGQVLAEILTPIKNDFLVATYHSCAQPNPGESQPTENKRRACNCAAMNLVEILTEDEIKKMEGSPNSIDPARLEGTLKKCREEFAQYPLYPVLSNAASERETNKSILFGGGTHRLTAFIQHVYTNDFKLLKSVELENGRYLYDISVGRDLRENLITFVDTGRKLNFVPFSQISQTSPLNGFDFNFFIPELSGNLAINSKKNLVVTQVPSDDGQSIIETHYVRSQALICTALTEVKERTQKQMATKLFREILLVAIKSYAGVGYGGGVFSGTTSTGASYSGSFSTYNNQWLGPHYSRGLDAIFNGGASLFQINQEMDRLGCADF